MSNSRGPSRTVSKELDRAKPSRSSSLRSDTMSQKVQGTGYKFKNKVLTTTLSIDEENQGTQKGADSKSVEAKTLKSARGGKSPSESGRGSRQITLIDDGQPPKSKTPYRRSVSIGDALEEDVESSTPRSARFLKRTRSLVSSPSLNSASKSTPTRVTAKRSAPKTIKDYLAPKEPVKEEQISQKTGSINGADVKTLPQAKIAYVKAKDGKYGDVTHVQDDDGERLNEEYRFKRSKRTYHKLQESIMGLMTKYKSDLEHLDDKIKSLESQFFNNPPEATGLIKGWEGNVLNNAYASLSNGLKSRRGLHNKLKPNFVQTQTVITEHIFSLTSSTCSISRMLLNND